MANHWETLPLEGRIICSFRMEMAKGRPGPKDKDYCCIREMRMGMGMGMDGAGKER